MMREAWQEIRLKQKENQEPEHQEEEKDEEEDATSNKDQSDDRHTSLRLDHMQGAFWILLLGSILGVLSFLGELITGPGQ